MTCDLRQLKNIGQTLCVRPEEATAFESTGGFGVFETYYFEILRILHKLKRVLLLERVRLCPFHFQEDFPFWK